jgi:hypothetical protein
MRKQGIIGGLILLVVGALLLVDNLGLLSGLGVNVWQLIWPTALIAFGLSVLWGTMRGRSVSPEEEHLVVPIDDSTRAEVELNYGAGEFSVRSGAEHGAILSGDFEGGVNDHVRRSGDTATIRISNPAGIVWAPWTWGSSFRHRWSIQLNDQIPLELTLKVGASDCRVDLTDLRVEKLRLETGASSTRVTLPAHAGHTVVTGSSGAASVSVRVPEGVAARIQASGGVASVNVNRQRFPRQGGVYVSPDYETAENRVDIKLEMGVGSLDIS